MGSSRKQMNSEFCMLYNFDKYRDTMDAQWWKILLQSSSALGWREVNRTLNSLPATIAI